MPIRFHSASCVIAGTFNIYVIRPDWLGQAGFLPVGKPVKVESQLTHPSFRLQSPDLGAKWTVSPERLILETDDPEMDCGRTADRILEILPWTPLRALGCNFAFHGQPADIQGWNDKTLFPPADTPLEFHCKQRTWHVAVQRDDRIYHLQLGELEGRIEIRANVHTDLEDRSIEFAREFARQFFEHRKTALSLIQALFETNIDHAFDHDG